MLDAICEKCNSDCQRVIYFIHVQQVTNFAKYPTDKFSDPRGSIGGELRTALCQECYAKLKMPNMFKKSSHCGWKTKLECAESGQSPSCDYINCEYTSK